MGKLLDKIKTMLEFSKNSRKTATGEPADEVIVYKEGSEKHAVFTFGRFNPPTKGHGKVIDSVKAEAKKTGGKHFVFASDTRDSKKNPLSYEDKIHHMRTQFPGTNVNSFKVKDILGAVKYLSAMGFSKVTLVVGEDRVDEFRTLLNKYNMPSRDPGFDPKKHFDMPEIEVKSAGIRDPDSDGIDGISASKLRAHAKVGNYSAFKEGLNNPDNAQTLYKDVRRGMNISEDADVTDRPVIPFNRPGANPSVKSEKDKVKKGKLADHIAQELIKNKDVEA